MLMTVLKTEHRLCTCCMEEHEVKVVKVIEATTFKGIKINYPAIYNYCDLAEEFYSSEDMLNTNNINMKNAYRKSMGLLSTDEIKQIRSKYGISQNDLCVVLGWGKKTITRYEGHAIQDKAHDSILRKISIDPEWFLELLEGAKDLLDTASYAKYYNISRHLYGQQKEYYIQKAEEAELLYAKA